MRVILASKSPRRREILKMLGVKFEVAAADTDETCGAVSPERLVEELSARKGAEVGKIVKAKDALIISADTVVSCDGEILGKPKDENDAARMLHMLSGKTHFVFSGLSLSFNGRTVTRHEKTEVTFSKLDGQTIERYVKTGEPMDKAGAYAVQGRASLWIDGINGCYYNVVGFPTRLFGKMLGELGIDPEQITE